MDSLNFVLFHCTLLPSFLFRSVELEKTVPRLTLKGSITGFELLTSGSRSNSCAICATIKADLNGDTEGWDAFGKVGSLLYYFFLSFLEEI